MKMAQCIFPVYHHVYLKCSHYLVAVRKPLVNFLIWGMRITCSHQKHNNNNKKFVQIET
jgi:hypothetical protein